MSLNEFVIILATVALQANPAESAIPTHINLLPPAAEMSREVKAPLKVKEESFGVATTADGAIVVDVGSGAVLYGKNAEVSRSIASLTKLVTAMIVLEDGLRPDETLTIMNVDFDPIGRRYFDAGESVTRGDAFRAMLVGSVNEIANAFARNYPGGRESFVDAMNVKAKTLGLKKANFHDPSGIESTNVASASDIARILRSAVAFPSIRDVTGSGGFDLKTIGKGRTIEIKPTNNLLSSYLNQDPYKIVVGKTGSLPEAGYCLGQVTRHPDGHEVIAVVLGSDNHFSRFQEVKALTAWAFETFKWE